MTISEYNDHIKNHLFTKDIHIKNVILFYNNFHKLKNKGFLHKEIIKQNMIEYYKKMYTDLIYKKIKSLD